MSTLCSQASGRHERVPGGTHTQLGAPAFGNGASGIKLFLDSKKSTNSKMQTQWTTEGRNASSQSPLRDVLGLGASGVLWLSVCHDVRGCHLSEPLHRTGGTENMGPVHLPGTEDGKCPPPIRRPQAQARCSLRLRPRHPVAGWTDSPFLCGPEVFNFISYLCYLILEPLQNRQVRISRRGRCR